MCVANETQTATFTCPPGHSIAAVKFASFGNPTGYYLLFYSILFYFIFLFLLTTKIECVAHMKWGRVTMEAVNE